MVPMMPKLWIVIYLVGEIAGTVGPLPYAIDECEKRAVTTQNQFDPLVLLQEGYLPGDLQFKCEWHIVRPQTAEKFGPIKEYQK